MPRQRYHPHAHSIPWIIVSRLIGLAIYLIIVVILSGIHSSNEIIMSLITFLVAPATIALVVTFSILFLVGEVFLALGLPLSLPGPFFNALGSVFLVSFLLQLLYLLDQISDITLFSLFRPLEPLLYFLVFLIVLIVQYVHLFIGREEEWRERRLSDSKNQTVEQDSSSSHSEVSWSEVEAEFRMMLYEYFHSVRDAVRKKKD
jgi:hypothetical protein